MIDDIVERLNREADDTRSEDREQLLREAAKIIEDLRRDFRKMDAERRNRKER